MDSENLRDKTESDATHKRFRLPLPINYKENQVTCLSCRQSFPSTSVLEVFEHYQYIKHPEFYSRCCYCKGKVHRYKTTVPDEIKTFHNCSDTKKGLDI